MTELQEDQRALLEVAALFGRIEDGMDRTLVGIIAAVHFAAALAITFAPDRQLVTPGTAPLFQIMGRGGWASLFLLSSCCLLLLLHRVTRVRQLLAWMPTVGLDATLAAVSVLTVMHGRGSALGMVWWLFGLAISVVAAVRVMRGKG